MPLVSLIDPDLSQEETVTRILYAASQFNQVANGIFKSLDERICAISMKLDKNVQRFREVNTKISTLEKLETAVVLKAPSKFPDVEYTPSRRILPFIPGVFAHPYSETEKAFEPKNTLGGNVDMKNELEQRKQYFATSQLMSSIQESETKRPVPEDIFSVADLFYVDSELPAYDKVGGSFLSHSSKSKSITSRHDQGNAQGNLDRTAIGGRRKADENDPFAFRPLSTDVPELELPDFLPGLPGVALDVVLTDLQAVASSLPDVEVKISIPIEIGSGPEPLPPPSITTPAAVQIPIPPPPPVLSNIPVPCPPPPPPPPPLLSPPPAPPPPPSPAAKASTTVSPAESGGRSDLMAAIRAAGGVGQVKLKSAKNTLAVSSRQAEEKQSLQESSALPSSSSGDLMSSLAKALESRRKAMAGTNNRDRPAKITGVMSRISEMIPSPKESGHHSDSGGEEWT